jgi:hypothetical protein
MDKCKFCGAEAEMQWSSAEETFRKYCCGTLANACEWERSDRCHADQLAQSEARARDLWETLEHVVRRDGFSYGHALDTVDKHADHFRKESEATNEIH